MFITDKKIFFNPDQIISNYLFQKDYSLFHYQPNRKGLKKRLEYLKTIDINRDKIHKCIYNQNKRYDISKKTNDNIDKLKKPNSTVVVCGHQPYLALGPLYVAYKILTAVKLCNYIEKEFNTPCTPVFWLGSDDEDIKEVNHMQFFDSSFQINTNYQGVCGFMESPCTKADNIPFIKAKNWNEYHKKLLYKIFKKYGIVLLDPLSEHTLDLRRVFFKELIQNNSKIKKAAIDQTLLIEQKNLKKQINIKDNDTFLFLLKQTKRQRADLNYNENNFYLTSAISRLLSIEYSMPIMADISGPSEIAYHAQTKKMYETLNRKMPVIIPRFSSTIISDSDIKYLSDNNISIWEIIKNRDLAEKKFSEKKIPKSIKNGLTTFETNILNELKNLEKNVALMDKNLVGLFKNVKRKIDFITNHIYKKCINSKRKNIFYTKTNIKKIFNKIFPGNLQERTFNFLYYSSTINGLTDKLYDLIDPFDFEHKIIAFNEKGQRYEKKS